MKISRPIHIRSCLAPLLCGLLLAPLLKCAAQTPHVYSFSELTGFQPKTIHGLLEDRKGHIWISTGQGLYKYNGTAFKHYTHPAYSSEMGQLHEDRSGRLWCNNFSGQVFYIEKDSLHFFKDVSKYITSFAEITSVYFPKIYLTTHEYGYLEIDFYSKKVSRGHYRKNKDDPRNHITPQGDTLFFEQIRAWQLFPQKLHLYRYPYLLEVNTATRDTAVLATLQPRWQASVYTTIYKKGEKLLLASSYGVQKGLLLEYGAAGIQKAPAPYTFIGGFSAHEALVENERLWLPTEDGLVALDAQYKSIYGTHKILPGKAIAKVIRDREGNYWIATKLHGIFILPATGIVSWTTENSALKTNEVKALEQDEKGTIYLGQADRNLFCLPAGKRKPEYLATMAKGCENMRYDPYRKRIWWGYTLAYYDLNRKRVLPTAVGLSKDFSFIDSVNVVYSNSNFASIINFSPPLGKQPPMDSLWRHSGLEYGTDVSYSSILGYPFHQLVLRRKRSMDNEYDAVNKSIWVSYVDGLYRYKNGKEKAIRHQGNPVLATALLAGAKGGVWVGTQQNRLLKIAGNGVVTLKKDSLPAGSIAIKQWKQYLFLATKLGIFKFNTENNDLELFNHLDGLPSNDINDIEIVNDTLYAATPAGLTLFPAGLSAINTVPPEIAISGLAVNEKERSLPAQRKLKLPFKENNLAIRFRARAVRSQGSFRYRYRMRGIDSAWVSVGSHIDFARYPSLPPGDYTFELRALNEDGIASLQPAQLQVFIATPYYRTWWFLTLIALGAAGILSTLFVLRLRAARVKKELAESQLSALRSQMNPHFIFNALNSIQSYIMSEEKVLAGAYLGRFAELMRLYLNHSNADRLTLSEEADALERYLALEKIRFEDELFYTITIDEALIPEDISIPSMLIQPFAENAVKHGLLHKKGKKKLTIDFRSKGPGQLLCSIEDNGIGRERSAQINRHRHKIHKSFATSAIENRLKLLNRDGTQKIGAHTIDLYDENQQPRGTRVELYITFV